MARDDLQCRHIALQKPCGTMGTVLVIDTVESEAADSLALIPIVWDRINESFARQCAVKSGVEDGDLRNAGN